MTKQNKKIIISLALILFLGLLVRSVLQNKKPKEEEFLETTVQTIEAETLVYGNWTPEGNRSVLVTVESDAEVEISAELSGTIAKVYAKTGDIVRSGQVLAEFSQSFDQTQINYQNTLSALEVAKASAQNSVQSSQIGLDTARVSLQQAKATESQGLVQTFDGLRAQAKNTEASFQSALDLLDQWVGYSPQYRFVSVNRDPLKKRDSVLFNALYKSTGDLLKQLPNLPTDPYGGEKEQVLRYAAYRIDFATKLQDTLLQFENLAQRAILSSAFPKSQADSLVTLIRSQKNGVNGEVIALNSSFENARTASERKNSSLLTAENQVKSAEANLQLARANADSQIRSAQNQVNSAYASKLDLVVRAPFEGEVSQKFINVGQQVSPGTQLFNVINPNKRKKLIAFLTFPEYQRLQAQESVEVILDGQNFAVEVSGATARLDAESQKMRVEFILDQSQESEVLVGQVGKLQLLKASIKTNVLPLSAISFEPDGAEVLIVNKEGVTERKKIIVGTLVSNALEIQAGIDPGTPVIKYRSRTYAGQKIKIDPIIKNDESETEKTITDNAQLDVIK